MKILDTRTNKHDFAFSCYEHHKVVMENLSFPPKVKFRSSYVCGRKG